MSRLYLHVSRFPITTILWLCGVSFFYQCSKDGSSTPPRPYDDWSYDDPWKTDSLQQAEPGSISDIHRRIFLPYCANSGCHDGNFEPDFRTPKSSYYSLIGHRAIKPDSLQRYPWRVVPGDADNSMLLVRMLTDLNGNSGIMPLSVDPGLHWGDHKEAFIDLIRQWINNGAKDMLGNSPPASDIPPQLKGFMVTDLNHQIWSRSSPFGPVTIPSSATSFKVWYAFEDDNKPVTQLTPSDLYFGPRLWENDTPTIIPFQVYSPGINAPGWNQEMTTYTHFVTLQKSEWDQVSTLLWFRAFVGDGYNPPVFLPSMHTLYRLQTYCSIRFE
jgi:hypothetical protein